jgi:hypothetical protein
MGNNDSSLDVKTGKVYFVNHTSYDVIIHKDYFNGPILLELKEGNTSEATEVRISDNYGVGTTFSIEFLRPISDGFDIESGIVMASMIDPNIQINEVIEENKSYTIQIPQPKNLEPRSAFIKILNKYNLPFELKYLETAFKQTGNGNLSVAPGKIGIYKLENIPSEGKLYQNYQVVSTLKSTTIPDFTAKNGITYNFEYDGTSVELTSEQTFVF